LPRHIFHEATKDAHIAAELTQRMLIRVAADMRDWREQGLPLQHVGINLPAADFRGGNLRKRLCQIFGDAEVADEIKALRAEGLKVALDDFGTGYASLTHLLTVPVDIIQIDKTFIHPMVPEDAGVFIVEGLLGLPAT
jgi:EAL domain-containing protein (putative c-di-GMP-specific phosphodiesterase class I)